MKYVIQSERDDEIVYWKADKGWVDSIHEADRIDPKDKDTYTLPEGGEWEENYEEESEASYDLLWAHKPRTEDGDDSALLDCDVRMGHVTEEEFEEAIKTNRLWTITEGDDGNLFAGPGYHYVNRISHHICEIPYTEDDPEPQKKEN